jgi:hypothetical protein
MRTHIRVDSVKVFDGDAERLERVMKKTKSKTKTEAYNKAVDFLDRQYDMQLALEAALRDLTNEVRDSKAKTNESLRDIYFKLSTVTK